MLTVIAKLPIKEGKMDEALVLFEELISKVATEDGTVLYSLNKDRNNPNMLIVVEQYKDKVAFEFHSSTPHFKAFFVASGALIGGEPEISVLKEIKRK